MNLYTRKLISTIVLVIMLLSSTAQAETVQPRFTHIAQCSVGLNISGGIATVTGGGRGCYLDTYSTAAVCLMYKPWTGGAWEAFDMWRDYGIGQEYTCVEVTCPVEYGYQYKVYLAFYIQDADGNILESFGAYSDVWSYP